MLAFSRFRYSCFQSMKATETYKSGVNDCLKDNYGNFVTASESVPSHCSFLWTGKIMESAIKDINLFVRGTIGLEGTLRTVYFTFSIAKCAYS